MTRLPDADAPSPKRTRYRASGTSKPQPLRGKRTSLLLLLVAHPLAIRRPANRNIPSRSTHDSRHEHPPHRRRLHWTLTIAGCDCGSRSAAREAGRSSLVTTSLRISQAGQPDHLHTCIPTSPPAPPRNTSRTKRHQFNVCRRAVSQTPAPLFLSALARRKARLCCRGAPSHPAAFSAHESHMECAIFIDAERRRCDVSDTTKHIWLPRTYDWQRTEQ